MTPPATLVAVLRDHVQTRPEARAFTYLDDGEVDGVALTFADLDRRASEVASAIAGIGSDGDRVPIVMPAGLNFIEAFFGCLYAQRVPVPLSPPRRRGTVEDCQRIDRIATATAARSIVTSPSIMDELAVHAPRFRHGDVQRIEVEDPGGATLDRFSIVEPKASDLAYLQYTSGSTLEPRGVMVTHANLLAATRHAAQSFQVDRSARIVSWLPHYHDMGLVGVILQTIYSGCQCWLMSPRAFAAKPDRWLAAITRLEATHSGGPDAAYDLCARRAAAHASDFALQSWRCAFTGAEPVRIDTLERFARAFEPSGFKLEQFRPTYGLAEATLQVTGGPIGVLPKTRRFEPAVGEMDATGAPSRSTSAVSCGRPWFGTTVRIVAPESRVPVPDGAIGEIWIRGPQVAAGYFGEPIATADVFGATMDGASEPTYLRSGDLGAMVDGELYVIGRLKDVIILNGVNHQPIAIEQGVLRREHDIEMGSIAAIGSERDGRERLVVIVEVRRRISPGVAARIRTAIFEEMDLTVQRVVFVPFGTFPRTTSGKIKRAVLRTQFESGRLTILSEA